MIVIGHRGAAGRAPENTRAAFEAGLRLGADTVECDVHLSKDGVPVVIHDPTLDRTTDGTGPVARWTWPRLKYLRAGKGWGPSWEGERLWRLGDLLDWVRPRRARSGDRAGVVVELKAPDARKMAPRVVQDLRRLGMVRRAWLISFDASALALSKRLCPSLRTGFLFSRWPDDLHGTMEKIHADGIFPRYSLITANVMDMARSHGWFVGTWTVDDRPERRRLEGLGVDALATNFPPIK